MVCSSSPLGGNRRFKESLTELSETVKRYLRFHSLDCDGGKDISKPGTIKCTLCMERYHWWQTRCLCHFGKPQLKKVQIQTWPLYSHRRVGRVCITLFYEITDNTFEKLTGRCWSCGFVLCTLHSLWALKHNPDNFSFDPMLTKYSLLQI